jgi:hypothetical protein
MYVPGPTARWEAAGTLSVMEGFTQTPIANKYALNVIIRNASNNEAIYAKQLIHLDPSMNNTFLTVRPTSIEMIGLPVQIILTDMSTYVVNTKKPLTVYIRYDPSSQPITVRFTGNPGGDVTKRTVTVGIDSYEELQFRF